MTAHVVSSGRHADHLVLQSGDTLTVLAGGLAYSATILSGAREYVSSGGASYADMVEDGGLITLSAGAESTGDTIQSGGLLVLSPGGEANDLTVLAGGVASGGGTLGTDVISAVSGPRDFSDYDYGLIAGLPVSSGAELLLESGGVAQDVTISSGGQLVVNGGLAEDGTTILPGGTATIEPGGVVSRLQVASGADLVLSSKTVSSGVLVIRPQPSSTTVVSGATLLSGSELIYDNLMVAAGGAVSLGVGTTLQNAFVSSGGTVFGSEAGELRSSTNYGTISRVSLAGVIDYGAVDDAQVKGDLTVFKGGVASGTRITGDEFVAYGEDIDAVVSSGGLLYVGGYREEYDYGYVPVFSGSETGAKILSGGEEIATPGAALSDTVVESGAEIEFAPVISQGEVVTASFSPVSAPTTIGGVTLKPGAIFYLSGPTVLSGGKLSVTVGAAVYDDVMVSSGGFLGGPGAATDYVYDYGVVSGTVFDGGQFVVGGSGSQGPQGGLAEYVTLESDGEIDIRAGGSATETLVISGPMIVEGGASAGETTVRSRGTEAVYGSSYGDKVSSGGVQTVEGGGVVSDGRALASGLISIASGGAAYHDLISAGGELVVSSGGLDELTTLSGGSALIYGSSHDAIIAGGGSQVIESGGVADDATVLAGGVLIDDGTELYAASGATTLAGALTGSGALIQDGPGTLVLSQAASFIGQAIVSGGTLELAGAGGVGASAIVFASGTLQLDAAATPASGATFASPLSNFDIVQDGLDLTGVAFVAGATASAVGSTLVVSDGGGTYDFTLAGTIASGFQVSSHGAGILITPSTDAPAASLIHAMASFASPRAIASVASAHGSSNESLFVSEAPDASIRRP